MEPGTEKFRSQFEAAQRRRPDWALVFDLALCRAAEAEVRGDRQALALCRTFAAAAWLRMFEGSDDDDFRNAMHIAIDATLASWGLPPAPNPLPLIEKKELHRLYESI
ncbi:hypothetical protein [Bradyrhizobium sp. SZCCHNPS2010]|uniref:hypothetical protein n=1 Tax=Bradyrhizobium sp. SZCCHNPS2010 TaxID=3057333 RepID=UPI002915D507|nr:hypothetical protein [Bradyrhizobium sp. SZCCHNPS2010]